jgi:hypothetical protein
MWALDKKNYEDEESRLKQRITQINSDNSQYLLNQMAVKNKKVRSAMMDPVQRALNKPLLKQVNTKLKNESIARS